MNELNELIGVHIFYMASVSGREKWGPSATVQISLRNGLTELGL